MRACYNRTRFVFEIQIAQLKSPTEIPVSDTVEEVDARLTAVLDPLGIPWHWGGSVSAWLQGVPLAPHDVDLGTTEAGVVHIGEALAPYLIEPVAATTWPGGRELLAARAFVGTLARGMRVGWGTDQGASPAVPFDLEWRLNEPEIPTRLVERNGHRLRVSRLEFALGRAVAQRRIEHVPALVAQLRRQGPDLELLDRVLRSAGVDAAAADPVARALRAA